MMYHSRSAETPRTASAAQALELVQQVYPGVASLEAPYIDLLTTTLLLPGATVTPLEIQQLPVHVQASITTAEQAIGMIQPGNRIFMGGTEEGTPPSLARQLTRTPIPEAVVQFLHPRPGFACQFVERVTGAPTFFPYFGGVELRPFVRSGELQLDDRSLGVLGQRMVEGDEDFDVVLIRTTLPFKHTQCDISGRITGEGTYAALMASELATAAYARAVERKQRGENVKIIVEMDPRNFSGRGSATFIPNGTVAVNLEYADAIVITESEDLEAPHHAPGKPVSADKQAIIQSIGATTVQEIIMDGVTYRIIQGGVGDLVNAALYGLGDHLQNARLATEAGLEIHASWFDRRGVLAPGAQAMGFSHSDKIVDLFRCRSLASNCPVPVLLTNAMVNSRTQVLPYVGKGFVAINTTNTVGINPLTGTVSIYSGFLSKQERITAQGGVADFLEAASQYGRAIIPVESVAVISSKAFEAIVWGNGGEVPLHRVVGEGKVAVSKVIIGETHNPTAAFRGNASIVTEHGAARFNHGDSPSHCTQALITVSHPMFRDQLADKAGR